MKSHKYPLPLQSNHPTSIHTKPHLHKPQSIQKHIIFTSLFSAMISKHSKSTHKTRTKLHKPKYLSLNHLTTTTPTPTPPPPPPMPTTNHHDHKHQQQLTLFPLHPENLVEQDHNMASIFSSCDNITTTLTQILCSENDDNENPNPSPSSVNYAQENVDLVRTAMRKTKTENIDQNNDEKWVCYSEVCSSISSTTTTSCHHINHCNDVDNNNYNNYRSKLVLKLDYEKIMKSWVNKGPLFIRGGSDVDAPYPQTVPDLHDDHFFLHSSINVTPHVDQDDDDGNAGSWTVPEMMHNENNGMSRGDDVLQAGESSAMGHNREASVQRYKEKRRNRLFAKTVRYEVRKLNAQKRPRIKGRFVKSS